MSKAKKTARGKGKTAGAKKSAAVDFRVTRQKVKDVVGQRAEKIAEAVADDVAQKAQVQAMKVLFELVGLFPESTEERQAQADDQSLARVLLERLGMSDEPAMSEEEAQERRELEESARAVMTPAGDPVK